MKKSTRRTPIKRNFFSKEVRTIQLKGHNIGLGLTLELCEYVRNLRPLNCRSRHWPLNASSAYFVNIIKYENNLIHNIYPKLAKQEIKIVKQLWAKLGYKAPHGLWPPVPTIEDVNDQLHRIYDQIDINGLDAIVCSIGGHQALLTKQQILVGCTTIKDKALTDLLSYIKKLYFNEEDKPMKRKTLNNPLK